MNRVTLEMQGGSQCIELSILYFIVFLKERQLNASGDLNFTIIFNMKMIMIRSPQRVFLIPHKGKTMVS